MADEVTKQEVTTVSTAKPQTQVVKTTKTVPPDVKTEPPQVAFEKKRAIFRTYQVVWYVLAVVEVLLGFRMTLKAVSANPLSGFTSLIYSVSDPLALPFRGILQATVSGDSVIEWSTIVAVIVYALIAYGIVYLLQMVKPVTPHEVEEKVENP